MDMLCWYYYSRTEIGVFNTGKIWPLRSHVFFYSTQFHVTQMPQTQSSWVIKTASQSYYTEYQFISPKHHFRTEINCSPIYWIYGLKHKIYYPDKWNVNIWIITGAFNSVTWFKKSAVYTASALLDKILIIIKLISYRLINAF